MYAKLKLHIKNYENMRPRSYDIFPVLFRKLGLFIITIYFLFAQQWDGSVLWCLLWKHWDVGSVYIHALTLYMLHHISKKYEYKSGHEGPRKVRLSCFLVLLSNDRKTRKQDRCTFLTWPICGLIFTLCHCRHQRVLSLFHAQFIHPSIHPERRHHSNSLRISAISLNFGGMIHSTMKQISL